MPCVYVHVIWMHAFKNLSAKYVDEFNDLYVYVFSHFSFKNAEQILIINYENNLHNQLSFENGNVDLNCDFMFTHL